MPVRRLPVRPDLEQLHRQAKEFLRAVHRGAAEAIAEFREHHHDPIDASSAKLADAQLVLARSYGVSSWARLVQAVRLAEAIWGDDLDAVRELITQNATLIIRLLHDHGARDLESAAGLAALQGKADTVRMIAA